MTTDIPKDLQVQVDAAVTLEKELAEQLALVKSTQDRIKQFWKDVEAEMIKQEIKSIKGAEWGSLTIAERLSWKVDLDKLPRKFIKRTADTKKLSDTFRLEGKAPAGAEPSYSKYLMKRLK